MIAKIVFACLLAAVYARPQSQDIDSLSSLFGIKNDSDSSPGLLNPSQIGNRPILSGPGFGSSSSGFLSGPSSIGSGSGHGLFGSGDSFGQNESSGSHSSVIPGRPLRLGQTQPNQGSSSLFGPSSGLGSSGLSQGQRFDSPERSEDTRDDDDKSQEKDARTSFGGLHSRT